MFGDVESPGPRGGLSAGCCVTSLCAVPHQWFNFGIAAGLVCLLVAVTSLAADDQPPMVNAGTAVAQPETIDAVEPEAAETESEVAQTEEQPDAAEEPGAEENSDNEETGGQGDTNKDERTEEKEEAEAPTEADASEESDADSANTEDSESKEVEDDNGEHSEEDSVPAEADDEKPTADPQRKEKFIIGATARFQETQSQIVFNARIDTGAETCSLHVEEIQVENEVEENMDDNIGKTIQFVVENGRKERHLCKAKIVNVVRIANAYGIDRRYKVMLTFRCEDFDFEKRVEVSLNDRSHKTFPLLIGRNYLRGDFLVDVSLGKQDD